MTTDDFVRLFQQGVDEFGILSSDRPDLTRFRDAGGKLVLWAGQSDPIIPPQGTIHYYNQVVSRMGGPDATGSFARLFLAPGVGHCLTKLGTVGPVPTASAGCGDELGRERCHAREHRRDHGRGRQGGRIPAAVRLPLVARYAGRGSTDDATNFYCARHFPHQSRTRPRDAGRAARP